MGAIETETHCREENCGIIGGQNPASGNGLKNDCATTTWLISGAVRRSPEPVSCGASMLLCSTGVQCEFTSHIA